MKYHHINKQFQYVFVPKLGSGSLLPKLLIKSIFFNIDLVSDVSPENNTHTQSSLSSQWLELLPLPLHKHLNPTLSSFPYFLSHTPADMGHNKRKKRAHLLAEEQLGKYHFFSASLWCLSWAHELGDVFSWVLIIFEGWVWNASGHERATDGSDFKMYVFHHCGIYTLITPAFLILSPNDCFFDLRYYKENWEPIK